MSCFWGSIWYLIPVYHFFLYKYKPVYFFFPVPGLLLHRQTSFQLLSPFQVRGMSELNCKEKVMYFPHTINAPLLLFCLLCLCLLFPTQFTVYFFHLNLICFPSLLFPCHFFLIWQRWLDRLGIWGFLPLHYCTSSHSWQWSKAITIWYLFDGHSQVPQIHFT